MQQQAYNFQFWYIPGKKKKKKESQHRSLFRSTYSQTWLLDALSAKVTEPCQHQCKIIRLPVVTIIICAPEESDQSSWSLCRDWIIGRKLVRCRLIDIFQSGRSAQGFFLMYCWGGGGKKQSGSIVNIGRVVCFYGRHFWPNLSRRPLLFYPIDWCRGEHTCLAWEQVFKWLG